MDATKTFSSKQEREVAEYLGAKVVSGSGSRVCLPADISSDSWLGECKTHVERVDYIEFKKSHWEKISKESDAKFKSPILVTDTGTQKLSDTWILCRESMLLNTGISMTEYPFKFRTNIKFNPNDISNKIIYTFTFLGEKLCILHIDRFREIINGEA